MLRDSAAINGFHQLQVDPRGVAAASGSAQFQLHSESEYNQIQDLDAATDATDECSLETIRLTSLDEWAADEQQLGPIRLIKIDTEGQEINIIKGARQLLREQSPLILYEIKHKTQIHLELVNAFAELGYQSYRLLPGPLVLEPFNPEETDPFLLNLFCCKHDLATLPENNSLFANDGPLHDPLPVPAKYGSLPRMMALPYALARKPSWLAAIARDSEGMASRALALHELSADETEPASRRRAALREAWRCCKRSAVISRPPSICRRWRAPLTTTVSVSWPWKLCRA